MKESHRKGVANHPDPESCGAHREVCPEALDRGTCGLSIELRKRLEWSADAVRRSGRQHGRDSESRETGRLCGVRDLKHAWKLSAREPGDPGGALRCEKAEGRKGNPQGHALHARCREVGPLRSTREGTEQTSQDGRRGRREGGGSRRTTWSNARTRHRAG
jgi:hypothetical protein